MIEGGEEDGGTDVEDLVIRNRREGLISKDPDLVREYKEEGQAAADAKSEKLRAKAAARIRDFLMQKLEQLKNKRTNIQILCCNQWLKILNNAFSRIIST